MSGRSRFWDADTGLPFNREATPLEEAMARSLPFHQHEWKGGTLRLQHSHEHGGEYHEHLMDDLVGQIEGGKATLLSTNKVE